MWGHQTTRMPARRPASTPGTESSKTRHSSGGDGLLAGGEGVVDGLESEEEDVRVGLAAAGGDALVVAEDAAVGGEDGEELGEVVGLELEVGEVGGGGEGDVDAVRRVLLVGGAVAVGGGGGLEVPVAGAAEVGEQGRDAGEGLGGGEDLALEGGELLVVVLLGDGELSPLVEEAGGVGAGAALELGLDGPGEEGAALLLENDVDAGRVEVLGVEEEAVHVEEAGPDGREAGGEGRSAIASVASRKRWVGRGGARRKEMGLTQCGEPL